MLSDIVDEEGCVKIKCTSVAEIRDRTAAAHTMLAYHPVIESV